MTAKRKIQPKPRSKDADCPWLTIVGARHNNLRNLDIDIPLERFVCVTGVSGSGKSSLVNDILWESLARDLSGVIKARPGLHDRIDGTEHLDKVIAIDQNPIGRTPRSNPSTYIKVFDEIRTLYTKLTDAKVRGYKPGRFSFNVHTGKAGGGRCEACEGNGSHRMEMDFLADIWVTCPVCRGHRFNRETLQIQFKGKSIADVLEMDVQEALSHFANVPKIARMLQTLHDVGLDYLKLGQPSPTLSGGEAQRIKLARELVKRATGRTLYILDEPTTGLHFHDIKKLLTVLHGFVEAGNSVVVIEHNLDVIKTADWLIDLGPEGGAGGGCIVAEGTPEQVSKSKRSPTGVVLREMFEGQQVSEACNKIESPRGLKPSARMRKDSVISVVGAREHNLKNIDVSIPRNKTTVCSGPSGSGKTSFAIDTLYAEGQRRYVESLSSYARQFLSRLQPPRVDHVEGLSPSICIERKTTSKSPRSTVGTITEVYDYMRILWTRIGQSFCPQCKVPIGTQSSDEIAEKVLQLGDGRRALLLSPIEPLGSESYDALFQRLRSQGYGRVRVDGSLHELSETIDIDKKRDHQVEVVVDRVVIRAAQASRITDSIEQALALGNGVMLVQLVEEKKQAKKRRMSHDSEFRYSQHHACDQCGTSYDELSPHHFSFNSRMGWCEACEGLGTQQGASPAAIVVHPTQSIADGAIAGWGELDRGGQLYAMMSALAEHVGFDLHRPWNKLAEKHKLAFLHGGDDGWINVSLPTINKKSRAKKKAQAGLRFRWRGFFPAIGRATRSSWQYRKRLEDLVTDVPCDACAGGRLHAAPAATQVGGVTIHEACLWPLSQTLGWFDKLKLPALKRKIAGELLHEIISRLRFLVDVGLDYVHLHRTASTLSGGESQRIQLASQIGTGLTGVLYVLDEPTIGLHPRDNHRLTTALRRLRDLGNTLVVVEHDREMIEAADHVLDFGPGAGVFGGEVTASGTVAQIRKKRASLTGQYLSGKASIPVPTNRRPVSGVPRTDLISIEDEGEIANVARTKEEQSWLTVYGAREHNLKEIDVSFPLGRFICVTGVSGSGKSSLVSSVLYNTLATRLHRARLVAGGHDRITGIEHVDKVINVDQSPIGNSPTSNPATYTGLFDTMRELFAKLPMSKIRGYRPGRFSFNRPGGRCEVCEGMGQRCIEMHFLPDVWVTCEDCQGARYVPETLEVKYRGKSISDVLEMRVSGALELFAAVPKMRRMLQTLDDVGLGYVQIGQSAPTLSGGEAQRVKLAAELGRPSTGKTLYILDEPTTGLHFDDMKKLLQVLHRLVDLGNTCICIEHNLDIIKTADWVIDLGLEAGEKGGTLVVEGTPEAIIKDKKSYTATALRPVLEAGPFEKRITHDAKKQANLEIKKSEKIDLGQEVKMPWQRNGVAWHTVEHLDHNGLPSEWDSALLIWLVDTIESLGSFAETDWNHRTRIEIKAPAASPWFAHILTGSKDLIEVSLRVASHTFSPANLAKLKLKTLDDRRDLPIYGQWDRARLRTPVAGWQEVKLYLRDFKDVSKPAFRALFKQAIASYEGKLVVSKSDPESDKPWMSLGMNWHLSQKSMSSRQVARWKPDVLMALVGRFKSLQPNMEFTWASKTAGQFTVPGESMPAGKIVTNMGEGLRVELRAPSGQFTPTQVDRLGQDVEIKRHPAYDRLVFWVRSLVQIDTKQLRQVWRACRETDMSERLQSA